LSGIAAYAENAVKQPFINVEEKIDRFVGRRTRTPDAFPPRPATRRTPSRAQKRFRHRALARRVHRFKTHEEADQWLWQMIARPANFWFNIRPFAGKFMYAVLETGSKQYRVAAGDTLEIERLAVEAGKPVTFDRVLLVNNDGKLAVGTPTVSGATVLADVVAHKRGEKKLTFKMKRRKGYHKTIGHRQELTVVKITEIKG
jgi:large subunit ribosomal protein L21